LAWLGVLILLTSSRLIELIAIPGLVLGSMLVLLLLAAVTNRLWGSLTSRPALIMLALSLWMVPCAVFGMWPGGSVRLVTSLWSRGLLLHILVVSLVSDLRAVHRIAKVLAFSSLAVAIMSFSLAAQVMGRFTIDTASLSNPNDLAFFLLLGLPFAVWYALDSRHLKIVRLIMAASVLRSLMVLLITGSRMGLVAAVLVLLVLFVTGTWRLRASLVLLAALSLPLAVAILPEWLERRYLTVFSSDVESPEGDLEVERAAGSARQRRVNLINSLVVTVQHPLFGVGPGNFGDANAVLTRETAERANWQQTHNAFTQVSSECGVPGALLFLALALYCLRHAYGLRNMAKANPALHPWAPLALCLFVAVVAYCVCAMFGSLAYGIHLPLLAGLVLCLERAFGMEASRAAAAAGK
jgi:O-antigen ligase